MCSVGQLSDPYNQGEDDELEGVSVAGLPGEPDEPPPEDDPSSSDGQSPADDDEMLYDLDDWSDMERLAVADRLNEATIPFLWDGGTLQVAAIDQAPVENILDIVGGGSAEPDPEPLDRARDQVAYDMSEWEDDQLSALADALAAAGIDYSWDSATDELFVYADDEEAADELFDKVAHPDQLDAEADDGAGGAELLGSIFVAADRLQHDGGDTEGTLAMVKAAMAFEAGEPPPYGVDPKQWDLVCERVTELGDLLSEDTVDEDEVEDRSRDLRTALRPFV
jgi:hypothetical protein